MLGVLFTPPTMLLGLWSAAVVPCAHIAKQLVYMNPEGHLRQAKCMLCYMAWPYYI